MLVAVCLTVSAGMYGQDFRTQTLRTAAEKLGIAQLLQTLDKSATSLLLTPSGQEVTVRLDSQGRVDHIGHPLFSAEVREQIPSPVYDFLEYAALDMLLGLSENTLQMERVHFFKGSWQTLRSIHPTDHCSIGTVKGEYYHVSWQRGDDDVVNMAIPIDYELLSNSTRRELGQNFARDIVYFRQGLRPEYHLAEELLQKYLGDDVYVLPGDSFLVSGLTTNTYYKRIVIEKKYKSNVYKEEKIVSLLDANYPGETLANVLLNTDPQMPVAVLDAELQLSGYTKKQVRVTWQQWLDYCKSQGCIPYYIYNDTDGQSVSGYLLMRNQQMGYNHLLIVSCPLKDLTADVPFMKGKAYLFIPSVEASRLFGSSPSAKSNEKIFE